jgi:hypothetical protein
VGKPGADALADTIEHCGVACNASRGGNKEDVPARHPGSTQFDQAKQRNLRRSEADADASLRAGLAYPPCPSLSRVRTPSC